MDREVEVREENVDSKHLIISVTMRTAGRGYLKKKKLIDESDEVAPALLAARLADSSETRRLARSSLGLYAEALACIAAIFLYVGGLAESAKILDEFAKVTGVMRRKNTCDIAIIARAVIHYGGDDLSQRAANRQYWSRDAKIISNLIVAGVTPERIPDEVRNRGLTYWERICAVAAGCSSDAPASSLASSIIQKKGEDTAYQGWARKFHSQTLFLDGDAVVVALKADGTVPGGFAFLEGLNLRATDVADTSGWRQLALEAKALALLVEPRSERARNEDQDDVPAADLDRAGVPKPLRDNEPEHRDAPNEAC